MKPPYTIFTIQLPEELGGGWAALVPEMPGCMGDGGTEIEAIMDAEMAVAEWMDEMGMRLIATVQ